MKLKSLFRYFILCFLCFLGMCVGIIIDVQMRYIQSIHTIHEISSIPHADVIMILGASVKSDGDPSDALKDRLLTGIDLLHAQLAPILYLTGDDGGYHQDEITVMKQFVLHQDVASTAIYIDGEGYRTYESCKHLKEQGMHSAIIVTQRFHIARALYICNTLGLKSSGVIADRQTYIRILYFWARDLAASIKAWFDLYIYAPVSPK